MYKNVLNNVKWNGCKTDAKWTLFWVYSPVYSSFFRQFILYFCVLSVLALPVIPRSQNKLCLLQLRENMSFLCDGRGKLIFLMNKIFYQRLNNWVKFCSLLNHKETCFKTIFRMFVNGQRLLEKNVIPPAQPIS